MTEAAKRHSAEEPPQHAAALRTRVQLPPGSVGKAYSRQLEVADLTNFHEVKAQGLGAIGLSIDSTGMISGVPTAAGNYPATINAFADRSRGVHRVAVEIAAEITVNPDPKSLWKNLDPPADASYRKPHAFSLTCQMGRSAVPHLRSQQTRALTCP